MYGGVIRRGQRIPGVQGHRGGGTNYAIGFNLQIQLKPLVFACLFAAEKLLFFFVS